MSQTASVSRGSPTPGSLRPASLWKRAAVGLLVLTFGVVIAAWLLHSSIDEATALGGGTIAATSSGLAKDSANTR